jgi:hypothetical protein
MSDATSSFRHRISLLGVVTFALVVDIGLRSGGIDKRSVARGVIWAPSDTVSRSE